MAGATSSRAVRLPREITSFVGRRHELRELREGLARAPIVTIVGPAGVGKTRIARQLASDLRRAFPDGVLIAELAELRDPTLLAETVATAVGLRDVSAQWVVSSLTDFLSTKRSLLVLDNCEHLVDASAVLADGLLRACPELKLLCTSRAPLGVGGELVLEVPPLPLPDGDGPVTTDDAMQYDGIRLFVERARVAWPDFQLTSSNVSEIDALCRHLDGLPLALELAAVKLRAFTVGQILEQIDQRFRILSGGSRTASARHQSLRAAIDWSFTLLDEREQVAWRHLSVFPGTFALDAAEVVCTSDRLPQAEVAETIAALVEVSIVRREFDHGVPRFRMLETIRSYGRERLRASGDEEELERRHRAWCADFAARVFEHSWGPSQRDWWERAHRELASLREALRSSLADPTDAVEGLGLAAHLAYYWLTRGNPREGRRWLDALLQAHPRPTPGRVMALVVDGWLAQLQGDLERGLAYFVEAEALARTITDRTASSMALLGLGGALTFAGQPDRAAELLEECLALQDGAPDERWAVNAMAGLAAVHSSRGDSAAASDLFRRAAALCREADDRYFLAKMLPGDGIEAWRRGDLEHARSAESETIRLSRDLEDAYWIALAADVLAWVAARTGEAERAARLFGGVQTLWESIPAQLYPTLTEAHDGAVTEARARLGDARFDRLFAEGQAMGADEVVAFALEEATEPRGLAPRPARRAPSDLTAREEEVAGLVAQGMSNRDIATRLVISQRTAETHVEHILTKLGFTSRSQIAAWVAHEGSPAGPSVADRMQR